MDGFYHPDNPSISPVEDPSTGAQVEGGTRPSILDEVMDDGGVALGGVVGVADEAQRHVCGHGVTRHAGDGYRGDAPQRVKLKHVLPLTLLEEQDHGLERGGSKGERKKDTFCHSVWYCL